MMRLLGSLTSPFVRRVRVVGIEKGLALVLDEINPFEGAEALRKLNPVAKVPALVTEAQGVLYDSRVICEYLDAAVAAPRLLPASGDARWQCLRLQALAEGVMDAAAASVMESRRAEAEISSHWQQRRATSMRCGAAEMARLQAEGNWSLDLGSIAAAVALAYLDFRHPEVPWRSDNPGLAAWLDAFSQRESMQATRPPAV